MPGDARLWRAIDALVLWQERNEGRTGNRCLEAVRHALTQAGLELPRSNIDYKGTLAWTCGETLAAKPARWGWRLLGRDARALPDKGVGTPVLVFFRACGWLPKYGRFAGHVAIYKPSTNKHISNFKGDMNRWWRSRVSGVFEPM